MECAKAFKNAKSLLLQNKMLVHYSTNLPLKLVCDASPYGGGKDKALKPYFVRRQQLSAEKRFILWGQKVIIPPILENLHHEHHERSQQRAQHKSLNDP